MKEEDLTDNDNLQLFILIAMFLNVQVMLLLLAKVCIIIIITCCIVKLLCYLNNIIKTKLPTSYNNRPV